MCWRRRRWLLLWWLAEILVLLLVIFVGLYALTAGDLSQTTGLHIPVDSGVAAAFLR